MVTNIRILIGLQSYLVLFNRSNTTNMPHTFTAT